MVSAVTAPTVLCMPGTPFGDVQIDFQDALLVHQQFEHGSDDGFFRLAPEISFAGKKQVLGQLLTDGGAARDHPAPSLVFLYCFLYAFPVEAVVLGKLRVFRHDHRALKFLGNARIAGPALIQSRARIFFPHVFEARAHEAGAFGVVIDPVPDVHGEPALVQQQCDEQYAQRVAESLPHRAQEAPDRLNHPSFAATAVIPARCPAAHRAR